MALEAASEIKLPQIDAVLPFLVPLGTDSSALVGVDYNRRMKTESDPHNQLHSG